MSFLVSFFSFHIILVNFLQQLFPFFSPHLNIRMTIVGMDTDTELTSQKDGDKTHPAQFDPITSLLLAGYSFRAYLEPPPDVHRQILLSSVHRQTPRKSRRNIMTYFSFPFLPLLIEKAIGAVSIKLFPADSLLRKGFFLTAKFNTSFTCHKLDKRLFCMLHLRPCFTDNRYTFGQENVLLLCL